MDVRSVDRVRPSIADVLDLARRHSNWGKWGADDQIGTLNRITKEMVSRAATEIRTGQAISCAIRFGQDGPQKGTYGRFNPVHLMMRDGGDALSGALREFYGPVDRHFRGTDDLIIMPTQAASHWDGLAHVFHDNKMYNGYSAADVSSFGARRNDITKVSDRIVGRGVLLDFPRAYGQGWLEPGTGITSADLDSVAAKQGVDVHEGDIVLVRTGAIARVREKGDWGDFAGGSAPGLALDSLDWIADRRIAAIAADTWGAEVLPNETPDVFQPWHIVAVVYMGLTVGEIFDLELLAAACAVDGRYSFFLSAQPLPISGAIASPTNPIAVR